MNSTARGQSPVRTRERSDWLDDGLIADEADRRPAHPAAWLVPIGFGLIWAIDTAFKWTPQFQHTYMQIIQAGAAKQPGWLGPWYQFWQTALRPYASAAALGTAIVETIITVALIVGFARKPTYILGALWSLGIWAIPEGFGNDDRAMSTDIGTSIAYAAVFAALWALDSCTGPRRYSLDALIERRFPAWKRIAEVGPAGVPARGAPPVGPIRTASILGAGGSRSQAQGKH